MFNPKMFVESHCPKLNILIVELFGLGLVHASDTPFYIIKTAIYYFDIPYTVIETSDVKYELIKIEKILSDRS